VGENPADSEARLKRLKDLAGEVSRISTGTPADVMNAFSQALNQGVREKDLTGGLARVGAVLADAEGMTKTQAYGSIARTAVAFQTAPSAELANTMSKSRRISGYETYGQFEHEMSRAAPAMGRYEGAPEDAGLLVAAMSRIRPEGAGAAVDAFIRGINDPSPQKRKLVQKYGLDRFFKDGKLVSPEEMDKIYADFARKVPSPQMQGRVWTEITGTEGLLVTDALRNNDFSDLAAERDEKVCTCGAMGGLGGEACR
jgi:hypothetical protein